MKLLLVFPLFLWPVTAVAQTVTAADLEGAVVEARVTMDQQIQRDGRQFGVQLVQQIRIAFLPENQIDWSVAPISHTPRGAKPGPVRKGTTTLGKPRDTKFLGGGQAIWIFEDNTLTQLRTYAGAGGYKQVITFSRQDQSIACSIRATFVREEGVGRVALRSSIDDVPVNVISAKQVGASCRVALKKS